MSAEEKIITTEIIPDTIIYAEFDCYYDEAIRQGATIMQAGHIAGHLVMKHDKPAAVEELA